jgi:hypothetical protein
MYYFYLIAFIILSVFYLVIFRDYFDLSKDNKNLIVLSLSSLIICIHLLIIVVPILGKIKLTVKLETYMDGLDVDGRITPKDQIRNFIVTFDEQMTFITKASHYTKLTSAQENDTKLLGQISEEKQVKEEYYKLKNSLTYFKINEMKEHTKFMKYAIIIVCFISLLYLAKVNDQFPKPLFYIVGTLSIVIYLTYVLLVIKTIMIRDKYDWDRMHWNLTNMKSSTVNSSGDCNIAGR